MTATNSKTTSTILTQAQTKPESIGKAVRNARKSFGWTQGVLAERADVSRLSVIRLENESAISTATLSKIVAALGFTLRLGK